MKAEEKFELLKERYKEAYYRNNEVNINLSFYNGFVLVGSSKVRVSKFKEMTETLENRLIDKNT